MNLTKTQRFHITKLKLVSNERYMKDNPLIDKTFRYERKFIVPYLEKDEVLQLISSNSYFFREIFYQRQVNNIYFDNLDMDSYFDNVLGNADRTKIRIRWYGEIENIQNPVLEVKIKKGLVGTKLSFPLQDFTFGDSLEEIQSVFEASDVPQWLLGRLKSQHFALVNNYMRRYFLSWCGKFRITMDSHMSYWNVLGDAQFSLSQPMQSDHLLLELKYDVGEDAEEITSQFPFRMTKSSKYVTGVNYFRGE